MVKNNIIISRIKNSQWKISKYFFHFLIKHKDLIKKNIEDQKYDEAILFCNKMLAKPENSHTALNLRIIEI